MQIVDKSGGQDRIVEHLGSAHSPGELAALMQVGRERLHPGQEELDLGLDPTVRGGAVVQSQSSRLLVEVIQNAWDALGFDVIADEGCGVSRFLDSLVMRPGSHVLFVVPMLVLGFGIPARSGDGSGCRRLRCTQRLYGGQGLD